MIVHTYLQYVVYYRQLYKKLQQESRRNKLQFFDHIDVSNIQQYTVYSGGRAAESESAPSSCYITHPLCVCRVRL